MNVGTERFWFWVSAYNLIVKNTVKVSPICVYSWKGIATKFYAVLDFQK